MLSASNLTHLCRRDPSLVPTRNRPLIFDFMGVTWPKCEILGPPNNFWTNNNIRFKFDTLIQERPLFGTDPKSTPNGRHRGHVTKMRTDGYHITEFSSSPGTNNYAYVHGGIVNRGVIFGRQGSVPPGRVEQTPILLLVYVYTHAGYYTVILGRCKCRSK